MNSFANDFIDYVCSGHSMLAVSTYEKDRATHEISKAAQSIGKNVMTWSIGCGWKAIHHNELPTERWDQPFDAQDVQPSSAITRIMACPLGESVWILRDFSVYLHKDTFPEFDIIASLLDQAKQHLSSEGHTVVFLGPCFQAPDPLKYDIAEIDFPLPDKESIETNVRFACEDVHTQDGSQFQIDENILPDIVYACQGMTQQQIIDRVTLALRKHKDLNPDAVRTIVNEKGAIIRSSGILTFTEPPSGGLDNVGGYETIKTQVKLDKPCFSDEARKFGIDFPKGILMVGIPGCGKTLLSVSIASEFGFPLVSMDVGSLMGSLVGESEKNMRNAIKFIESIAPCVCQLDEIEKAFGGRSDLDGGSSKRLFGTFLKWLNDRLSPVYFVATANEIRSLPPEMCRKGRFDEIFGLDLPSEEERTAIFDIQFKKRDRDYMFEGCKALATKTEGFTGADIEQVVKEGLKIAFSQNRQDTLEDFEQAIKSVIPLSVTEPQRIADIREWCSKHAKAANPKLASSQEPAKRRVQLGAGELN